MSDEVHFRGRRLTATHVPMLSVAPPEPWKLDALCAHYNPELFYPESGRAGLARAREAKAICAACPVRAACLAYALERGERFGIFGGLSPQDRAKLRRAGAA